MILALILAAQATNSVQPQRLGGGDENVPWDRSFAIREVHSFPVPASDMAIHTLLAMPDLDADGTPDVVMSGGTADFGGNRPAPGFVAAYSVKSGRRLWVVRGDTEFDSPQERLGMSAILIDDIDEDRIPDVCVSAPGYRDTVGRIVILSGTNGRTIARLAGSDLPAFKTEEGSSPIRIGSHIRLAGDIDGDGFRDLLVGVGGLGEQTFAAVSAKSRSWIRKFSGFPIGGAGHADGDHVPDVIGLRPRGMTLCVYSSTTGETIRELSSGIVDDRRHVASMVDDLDHDGLDDVAIRALMPGMDQSDSWRSSRLLVLSTGRGRPILDFTIDVGRGAFMLEDIRAVGDLDGDGVPDLGVDLLRQDAVSGCYSWISFHSGKDGSLLSRYCNPRMRSAMEGMDRRLSTTARVGFCGIGDTDGNGRNEVAISSGGESIPFTAEELNSVSIDDAVRLASGRISIIEIQPER